MTRQLFRCLLIGGLIGLAHAAASADEVPRWRIDPVHSRVVLRVSHAGFSSALATLSAPSGELHYDPEDWRSAEAQVVLALSRLDFGDADWNRRMAKSDFFGVRRHPLAQFESTRIVVLDSTRAEVHGLLTLRGVQVPVSLSVQRNAVGRKLPWLVRERVGFSARATLQRADFGMDRYPTMIGDDVQIEVEIEAERARE